LGKEMITAHRDTPYRNGSNWNRN